MPQSCRSTQIDRQTFRIQQAKIGVAVFEDGGERLEKFCDIVECSQCEVAGCPVQQSIVEEVMMMPELWRVGQVDVDTYVVNGRRERGKVQPR